MKLVVFEKWIPVIPGRLVAVVGTTAGSSSSSKSGFVEKG